MKQISDMRRKSIADDYEYLRNNVIPNLKRELSEYEIKVATMDDDITSLRAVIRSRDDEILKLKTEIHKLKVSTKVLTYFSFFILNKPESFFSLSMQLFYYILFLL